MIQRFIYCVIVIVFTTILANASEIPIGQYHVTHGMRIGAVYLQSVPMEKGPGQRIDSLSSPYAVHIELDIHATQNNKNGFANGEWIPYLTVSYELRKIHSPWKIKGYLMPMVANDGPHYGKNITLDGPGEYHLIYLISPPYVNGFYRHIDQLTGVDSWWSSPIEFSATFFFSGVGKVGGY